MVANSLQITLNISDSSKIKRIDFIKKDGTFSTLNKIHRSIVKQLGRKNGHNTIQIDLEVSDNIS